MEDKLMNTLKIMVLTTLLILPSFGAKAQCQLENTAFKSGEFLSFNMYFNWKFIWVKVGSASMSVVQSRYQGKPAYRGSLLTRGNSRADKLFVLRDTLLSYTTLDLAPLYYRKAALEGSRYYIDEVFYSYPNGDSFVKQHQVSSKGVHEWKQHTLSDCVYDMMNMFLRARSFNPSNWKKGYEYPFTMIDGNKTMSAKIKYNGKTVVKADNGLKYRCLQLSYLEKEDGKFKQIVDFFITDDANHVPIRLDMYLNFGSAKAFLVGMKGQRSAMTSLVN